MLHQKAIKISDVCVKKVGNMAKTHADSIDTMLSIDNLISFSKYDFKTA